MVYTEPRFNVPVADGTYGIRYGAGMEKTTVYLPEGLQQRIKRVAARKRISEAAVIRAALEHYTTTIERPRPRTALYETGAPIADWDAALEGFGEQ